MSSRANSGKKQVRRVGSESNSIVVKHQVVRAEFTPPAPQVIELRQENENNASSVNWNVVGFLSAAVSLIGAAILFILGWAYEVNWYGYFGVSMSQVNIQPQNVLIQSIPSVVTFVTFLIGFVIALFLAGLTVGIFMRLRFSYHDPKNKNIDTTEKKLSFTKENFRVGDWLMIFVGLDLTLILEVFIWMGNFKTYGVTNTIYEVFYLEFLTKLLSQWIGIQVLALMLISFVFFIAFAILKKKPSYQIYLHTPQRLIVFVVLFFFMIWSLVAISATYAINDAAKGYRGSGGWNIQPVTLVTSEKIASQQPINQSCDGSSCMSGPFGLIGENDRNYILIKWKDDNILYYQYHPGVYIIPKSETRYLIPYSSGSVAPIPQPSLTPMVIFTPTIQPTVEATSTPAPSSQP